MRAPAYDTTDGLDTLLLPVKSEFDQRPQPTAEELNAYEERQQQFAVYLQQQLL